SPTVADSLIAWDSHGAAASELRALRRLSADGRRDRVSIQHAKALLCRLPHKSALGIDEFILRVMTEVVMVMTGGELEQPVIGSNVGIGVSDDDVSVADIRRFHRETNDGAKARRDTAFFHAARSRVQLFISNHPLVAEEFGVDDQVRRAGC